MTTKTLNTHEKLWLANRASHNMALAGPTAFWLASGHREARPLKLHKLAKSHIRILTNNENMIKLAIFTFILSHLRAYNFWSQCPIISPPPRQNLTF